MLRPLLPIVPLAMIWAAPAAGQKLECYDSHTAVTAGDWTAARSLLEARLADDDCADARADLTRTLAFVLEQQAVDRPALACDAGRLYREVVRIVGDPETRAEARAAAARTETACHSWEAGDAARRATDAADASLRAAEASVLDARRRAERAEARLAEATAGLNRAQARARVLELRPEPVSDTLLWSLVIGSALGLAAGSGSVWVGLDADARRDEARDDFIAAHIAGDAAGKQSASGRFQTAGDRADLAFGLGWSGLILGALAGGAALGLWAHRPSVVLESDRAAIGVAF